MFFQFVFVPERFEACEEFPFTLDPFQTEAIKCLDARESVMVSIRNLRFNSYNYNFIFYVFKYGLK